MPQVKKHTWEQSFPLIEVQDTHVNPKRMSRRDLSWKFTIGCWSAAQHFVVQLIPRNQPVILIRFSVPTKYSSYPTCCIQKPECLGVSLFGDTISTSSHSLLSPPTKKITFTLGTRCWPTCDCKTCVKSLIFGFFPNKFFLSGFNLFTTNKGSQENSPQNGQPAAGSNQNVLKWSSSSGSRW